MNVEKLFHMVGGDDENSYASNSSFQKKVSDRVLHTTIKALQDVYLALRPNCLGIADLGCSSGPNTLSFVKETVKAIEAVTSSDKANKYPEFIGVYLNDLPTNDFNSIFISLPDLYRQLNKGEDYNGSNSSSLFVAAYPGSFYGRLFPDNFVHFVYSSFSLHWLSKIPPGIYDVQRRSINKGKVYISATSPPGVALAYESQFRQDFSLFLRFRSEELVSGGRMVLILIARIGQDHVDRGHYLCCEILSRSLAILVAKGTIDEEKLDSYDLHFYSPSKEEIEEAVGGNGRFMVEQLDMYDVGNEYMNGQSYGAGVATTVRAVQGPMLSHHFSGEILEPLFDIYGRMVDEEISRGAMSPITCLVVLRKL